jgi:hypothetical protein
MDIVERAKELAHRAHAGQVDKAGRPYIEHVVRVAAAVADDPVAEAVAWLHDVVEDCPHFESEVLDLPVAIWIPVYRLTRDPRFAFAYYAGISADPIALRVKLADIADNADEARLALLDEATASRLRKKYARALEALTGSTARAGRGGG